MQGFLVQTLQDAASLTIPSSARLHSNEQGLPGGYEGITLAAKNVKNQSVQESILRFDPSSTQGYDPAYDVRFMEGYAPGFFSVEGEDHLLVNTFPEMSETLEIPYGFYAFEPGSYTIELVSSLPGLNLYLNDHKTMTEHHLTIPESYTFVWEPGDELQRFVLSFKESGINGQETEKFPELKAWAVKGRLMISSNAPATEIEIINMYGQLCYRENILNRGTFEIPVMLETGIYLVRMSAGQAMRTVKIMLQ